MITVPSKHISVLLPVAFITVAVFAGLTNGFTAQDPLQPIINGDIMKHPYPESRPDFLPILLDQSTIDDGMANYQAGIYREAGRQEIKALIIVIKDFDVSRDVGLAMELIEAADNYMKGIDYSINDHDPMSSWQLTPEYGLILVRAVQLKPHNENSYCLTIYRLYPDLFLHLSLFFLILAMAASIIYYTL